MQIRGHPFGPSLPRFLLTGLNPTVSGSFHPPASSRCCRNMGCCPGGAKRWKRPVRKEMVLLQTTELIPLMIRIMGFRVENKVLILTVQDQRGSKPMTSPAQDENMAPQGGANYFGEQGGRDNHEGSIQPDGSDTNKGTNGSGLDKCERRNKTRKQSSSNADRKPKWVGICPLIILPEKYITEGIDDKSIIEQLSLLINGQPSKSNSGTGFTANKKDGYVNIVSLKNFAKNRLANNSALLTVLLAEPDELEVNAFHAKVGIWLRLLSLEDG